jgi:GntR family transcriptional regulator / MocR family aminotransferase
MGDLILGARNAEVAVGSLAYYCDDAPGQPGLVIGYGSIERSDIAEGLRRLAEVLH